MIRNNRHLENLHIPMWLIKDTCWMLHWKLTGTLMAFPTIAMAVYLVWMSRRSKKRFWPNLAVLCWIGANATWMFGEFFNFGYTVPALVLFVSGMIAIGIYMVIYIRELRSRTA